MTTTQNTHLDTKSEPLINGRTKFNAFVLLFFSQRRQNMERRDGGTFLGSPI
jgi:hypothetical protein